MTKFIVEVPDELLNDRYAEKFKGQEEIGEANLGEFICCIQIAIERRDRRKEMESRPVPLWDEP